VAPAPENTDTGPIYVEDYNLQNYVPVPAAGEAPVKAADRYNLRVEQVTWYEGETDITGGLDRFELGKTYKAEITLTAKPGYAFKTDQPFVYPAGASPLEGDNSAAGSRTLKAVYGATETPGKVDDTVLTLCIPKPVTGAVPVSSFTAFSGQYAGSVAWKKTGDANVHIGLFAADTAYTATVSLYPAAGYTLAGVGAGDFIHDGAALDPDSVSYDENTKTVTVNFRETDKIPISGPLDLSPHIPKPVTGVTGTGSVSTSQYTGTVAWTETNGGASHAGPFAEGTAYTATVTLTPAAGYTFTGVADNAFTHTGASVAYTSGDNVVAVSFAATEFQVLVWGSSPATPNSARKLMKARRDDPSITQATPLVIDLPAGTETVTADSTLDSVNAPRWVVINGNGRTLRLAGAGNNVTILEVIDGVTLTLRDMTLQGTYSYNHSPLVGVSGATLNLENVVIRGNNRTIGSGGGVEVKNGASGRGILNMTGGAITENYAGYGGGVHVAGGGEFNMRSGTISDNRCMYDGGGIYVLDDTGKLDLSDALIRNNTAGRDGGGIYVNSGETASLGGTMGTRVTANRADQHGGGVYFVNTLDGTGDKPHTFTMGAGVILDNTAGGNGGGVYVARNKVAGTSDFEADFVMSFTATIRSNTATLGAGVYLGAKTALGMASNAVVNQNNPVYMNSDSRISITGKLETSPTANIDGGFSATTKLLYGDVSNNGNYSKFLYKGVGSKFDSSGWLTP
jgi:hypothetical protein